MKNIFLINGGQHFAQSGGSFNKTVIEWTVDFLQQNDFNVKVTDINSEFNAIDEVENFKWADVIIYNTPIWWFQVPNRFKKIH